MQMVSSEYWKKHQYMNYFRGFDLVLTNQNQDQTTHKHELHVTRKTTKTNC